jgi:hypothetical protein
VAYILYRIAPTKVPTPITYKIVIINSPIPLFFAVQLCLAQLSILPILKLIACPEST